MERPRRVDTGGLPFRELRERDRHYVDKTPLIKDLLDSNDRGNFQYTRPRRFGKSTNITMLDAFFNIDYKGNDWFDGLAISEHHEYDSYRNAFPVILLNLKDIVPEEGVCSYETFLRGMSVLLRRLFRGYGYLRESPATDQSDRDIIDLFLNLRADEVLLANGPAMLMEMLKAHHGRNVVVLIDEYDRAITNSFPTDVGKRILGFMSLMMSSMLKDNPNLQMGYITGITQVAKAGMISGLNNLTVNNIFSLRSDERFGFTESEVEDILTYYGHPERMDEARQWYDGYRFGDADVYNPFSVMMYVQSGFVPAAYRVDSGKAVPIRWMLRRVDVRNIGEIANMINGNASTCRLHDTMTFEELSMTRKEDLYSLMAMTGHINAVPRGDGLYDLSIPNLEVMREVERMLDGNVRISGELFARFNAAVLEGDAETMAAVLQRVLCDASYFDLRDEVSYELIVLTIMHEMLGGFEVRAQPESGNGRADLVIRNRKGDSPSIIMELKVSASEAKLDDDVDDALAQIHRMRYYLGMTGKVILIGVAFWGKVPKASTQVLELRDPLNLLIPRADPQKPGFLIPCPLGIRYPSRNRQVRFLRNGSPLHPRHERCG